MRFSGLRFTNSLLLAFVLILTLTGIYGLFWTVNGWMFTIHRITGWALIALLPWKTAIAYRSLRRKLRFNLDRSLLILLSLLLAAILLVVLTLGVLWNEHFGPEEYWLRQTAVSWHWMLALGLLIPFAIHVWQRWPKPKRIDFTSRRAALRLLTAGSLGAAGYLLAQALSNRRDLPQALRRFTGSRASENFTGNLFPVTQSFPVHPDQINPQTWRLRVIQNGRSSLELTYTDLLALPTHEINATLDCTLGWYSTQTWRGVRLVDLLKLSGASPEPVSVRLQSVTGYSHIVPFAEAKEILLATHVGGEALVPDHGFPVRAVVPSRRGWFWVKWLAQIEPVDFLPTGES